MISTRLSPPVVPARVVVMRVMMRRRRFTFHLVGSWVSSSSNTGDRGRMNRGSMFRVLKYRLKKAMSFRRIRAGSPFIDSAAGHYACLLA